MGEGGLWGLGLAPQGSLAGGQRCDVHPIWGAAHGVQPYLVEELYGLGVAPVLPADAHLEEGVCLPATLHPHPDQLSHAVGFDATEAGYRFCQWSHREDAGN